MEFSSIPDRAVEAPAVSIIIPVYNCPGYLSGAVESVLAQTRSDWELIIIDDGSDDGITSEICDSFATDPRIRVFHKTNGGISDARNFSLPLVRAEFIAFLDADDLLHPRFVELTLKTAADTGADIVFGKIDFFKKIFKINKIRESLSAKVFDPKHVTESALYQTGFDNGVCGKIYSRQIWEGLSFCKGRRYEDLDIFYKPLNNATKVALVPINLYGYRQHASSYMHQFSYQRLDVLVVVDEMQQWFEVNMPELLPAVADRRFSAYFNILLLLYKNKTGMPEVEERCINVIKRQCKKSLKNRKVRIKNRIGALIAIITPLRLLKILAPFFA